jgi:hypothetical protein
MNGGIFNSDAFTSCPHNKKWWLEKFGAKKSYAMHLLQTETTDLNFFLLALASRSCQAN